MSATARAKEWLTQLGAGALPSALSTEVSMEIIAGSIADVLEIGNALHWLRFHLAEPGDPSIQALFANLENLAASGAPPPGAIESDSEVTRLTQAVADAKGKLSAATEANAACAAALVEQERLEARLSQLKTDVDGLEADITKLKQEVVS